MNRLHDWTTPTEAEIEHLVVRPDLHSFGKATAPSPADVRRLAPRRRREWIPAAIVVAVAALVFAAIRAVPEGETLTPAMEVDDARYLDGIWVVRGDASVRIRLLAPLQVEVGEGTLEFSRDGPGTIEVVAGSVHFRASEPFRVTRRGDRVHVDGDIDLIEPPTVDEPVRPDPVAPSLPVAPPPPLPPDDGVLSFNRLLDGPLVAADIDGWIAAHPGSPLVAEARWLRLVAEPDLAALDAWIAGGTRLVDAHELRARVATEEGRCDLARADHLWVAAHTTGARAEEALRATCP